MAALSQDATSSERRAGSSPRPKGRENAKETLCRNVTIYGHCRYEDKGCAFSHDTVKPNSGPAQTESLRKRFNVDSPAFTPASLPTNGNHSAPKSLGLSPRTANAVPFRPKNMASVPSITSNPSTSSLKSYNPNAPDFMAPDVPDFVPQQFNHISTGEPTHTLQSQNNLFDQYNESPAMSVATLAEPEVATNPYAADTNGFAQGMYSSQISHHRILDQHLYAALEPPPQGMQPNQRTARDQFIPEDIRQKLSRKSQTTRETYGSTLTVPPYQQLTQLLEPHSPKQARFGYESTVYKALDSRDGRTYCLRRIHNFKIDEAAVEERLHAARLAWSPLANKKLAKNSSIVSFHVAFTDPRHFSDSSLMIVTDYHPDSTTLFQHHSSIYGVSARRPTVPIPEDLMWRYLVQIASALKIIHSADMAARLIDANKIIVTDENRIRFNGCALADILDPTPETVAEGQSADLAALGKLMLWLGTVNSRGKLPVEQFPRTFSRRLVEVVDWLIRPNEARNIEALLQMIAPATINAFDGALQTDDTLQFHLNRELENGRLVRLLLKLNSINERPEHEKDPSWNAHGTRGQLKLFRDYVFHQVDAQNHPVVDMGHMLACLNKLDAGLNENMTLTTRDNKSVIIVTYKEMKQAVESAWLELNGGHGRRR